LSLFEVAHIDERADIHLVSHQFLLDLKIHHGLSVFDLLCGYRQID